jgi:hypothetical protein
MGEAVATGIACAALVAGSVISGSSIKSAAFI